MQTVHNGNCITIHNINPNVKSIYQNLQSMDFDYRGPLSIRAGEIEEELKKGVKKPFERVIRADINDSHAMGQQPITFIRQVLALIIYNKLFEDPSIPEDCKKRAKEILNGCHGHSIGSYSDSSGIEAIRRHVARYIERRDGGIPCNHENIILSEGALGSTKSIMGLFRCQIEGKRAGIMVPIPQFPLYSAIITELNLGQIGYYLDEEKNWRLDISELQRAVDEAKTEFIPRVLVVINPGNPTGQVLTHENIEEIIKFAYKERLFIFADEVYQNNIYAEDSKFHSVKKVMTEMGEPYSKMEIASFMSCSKGYMGEYGIRSGYAEVFNMCPDVKAVLLRSIAAQIHSSSTIGQVIVSCITNPPQPSEASYELFTKEKTNILSQLKYKAELIGKKLNSFEGFSCNPVQGAMNAFPQIKLPPKAIEAAIRAGQAPDVFYALHLLEKTGICILPGSGFGQKPGTWHFRTTILPQTAELEKMLQSLKNFHLEFMNQYK